MDCSRGRPSPRCSSKSTACRSRRPSRSPGRRRRPRRRARGGIIHRDLKPENVFLAAERDGSDFPKLLDFGSPSSCDDDVAHKTGSASSLGTPLYMSPEQAADKKVDHRTDIYSLGVMIYEMLTGAVPFAGDSAMDVVLKHDTEPPPAMSSVCPDLPPALDTPVLAMLEKRPRIRPASAGEAVAALVAQATELGLVQRPAMVSVPETPPAPSVRGNVATEVAQAPARSEPSSTERMSALDSSSVNRKNGASPRWLFAALFVAAVVGTASFITRSRAPRRRALRARRELGNARGAARARAIPSAAPEPAPPEITVAPASPPKASASAAPKPMGKPASTGKTPPAAPRLDRSSESVNEAAGHCPFARARRDLLWRSGARAPRGPDPRPRRGALPAGPQAPRRKTLCRGLPRKLAERQRLDPKLARC